MYIDLAGKPGTTATDYDYYIIEMPNTSPDVFLADSVDNCSTSNFDYCFIFPDINRIIIKYKSGVAYLPLYTL